MWLSVVVFVVAVECGFGRQEGWNRVRFAPIEYPVWGQTGSGCPSSIRGDFDAESLLASGLWPKVTALMEQTLDEFERLYAAKGWNVSMALEVVVGKKQAYSTQRGVLSRQMPYRLGSVTKIFTTLLYYLSLESGQVSTFTRPEAYFNDATPPAFRPVNPWGDSSYVTLANLADFSSGLPREGVGCVFLETCTPDQSFLLINQVPLRYPPGSNSMYSNFGIALLGRTIERARNTTYESLIADLLSSMGLTSGGFDPSKVILVPGTTIGPDGKQRPDPYQNVNGGWINPAGGLFLSPQDLARFMQVALGQVHVPGLSASSLRAWQQSRKLFNDGISGFGDGAFEIFSLGDGVEAVTKGGLLTGYAASVAMVPEFNTGLSINMNIPSGIDTDIITAQLMSKVLVPAFRKLVTGMGPLPAGPTPITGTWGDGQNVFFDISPVNNAPPNAPQLIANNAYGLVYNNKTSGDYFMTFDYSPLQSSNSICMNAKEAGDGSIYVVVQQQGSMTMTIPDMLLYNLVKMS